jgi:hypothetical protein
MKKLFTLLAITFLALNVNAQWFVAGSIGVNVNDIDEKITWDNGEHIDKRTEIGFSIAPKGGYYFNEKLAAGLSVSIGANFVINDLERDNLSNRYRGYSVNWRFFHLSGIPCLHIRNFPLYWKEELVLEVHILFGK